MKKIIICTITMQEKPAPIFHIGEDRSIQPSLHPVVYSVTDYISQNLKEDDEVKAIMICKEDPKQNYLQNCKLFQKEFQTLCALKCKRITYHTLTTPFDERPSSHMEMAKEIVRLLPNQAEIIADITYGSKDFPIVLFAVLSFAQKFLQCDVSRVLYRRVYFSNNVPQNPVLCDISPLFHLISTIYTLNCPIPDKARNMFERLLSFM